MNTKTEARALTIRPSKGNLDILNLRDLWYYRELIYFLTWRDLKVRYKQTLLGATWAVLQPFLTMVIFSIFFGNLAKVPSGDVPYPIFTFAALLPWSLFSKALTDASRSLVANNHMITKIYFPRIILPLSSILAGIVDFVIAFGVMILMMIYYQTIPTSAVFTLPLFILLVLITAFGIGLWLSALNVLYRDVGYVIPFLTQLWLFITPIAYPSNLVPSRWQVVYALNPMVGVVDGFRWALLGSNQFAPSLSGLITSSVIAIVLLVSGMIFFRKMERLFADMV